MTLAKSLEAQGEVSKAVRVIDAELELRATSATSGGAYASQQALRKRLTAKRDELRVKATTRK